MYFESFADFLAMGRHGLYVWLCYGIGLVVIAANIAAPVIRRRTLIKQYQRTERRERKNAPTA